MGETFSLFWRRVWDNLGHVIVFNMIWLTTAIFLFLAVYATSRSIVAGRAAPLEPVAAADDAAEEVQAVAEAGAALPADREVAEMGVAEAAGGEETRDQRVDFEFTTATLAALVFLFSAWLLFCAATGFVNHGMADIVTTYDFSGYREAFKTYLRKGPVGRSIAIMTLFVVTFVATWANIIFYLNLVLRFGWIFLLLAGVMLWFALLVTMVFMLALPLVAQRDMKTLEAVKVAAIFALSSPVRSTIVLATGFVIFLIGLMSGAGAGFFAVAAPLMLFNADAKVRLDKVERGRAEETGDDEADGVEEEV